MLADFSFEDLDRRLLGLLGVLLVAALVGGAFAAGALGLLRDRYAMDGVFDATGGLKAGADVRVAGVEVGTVTGIEPDFHRGHVVVSWEVDRGVDLGPATRARIEPGTLLGSIHLELSGPVTEPHMADRPPAERRIPAARTSQAGTVVDTLESTTDTLEALDEQTLNEAVGQLADISGDVRDDVGGLVANLQTVATAVNRRDRQLRELVDGSRRVTAALADRDEELVRLIDAADVLLDRIVARRDELATLLGDGSDAVRRLTRLIEQHRGELDRILRDVRATLATTDRSLPELNRSLAFLGPALDSVVTATGTGPWIDFLVTQIGPGSPELIAPQDAGPTPGSGEGRR